MIPQLLRLENFLSYGPEPVQVEFRGLGCACLSGGNGAGKSALLEAMTWALWGKARGGNIEADRLINASAGGSGGRMRVVLEFICNGDLYKVERWFQKKGKSASTTLSLWVYNSSKKSYQLWSEGVRQTQRLLLELLGLDYETFITTSFLLQGQADRFHRASDSEKKEILGRILGLSLYDRLAEAAREEARLTEGQLEALEGERSSLRAALRDEGRVLRELEEVLGRVQALEGELGDKREKLDKLGGELAQLGEKLGKLRALREEREKLANELSVLGNQEQAAKRELSSLKELLARSNEIRSAAKEQARLQAEAERWGKLLAQDSRLAGEITALEKKIAQRERGLLSERATLREESSALKGELKSISSLLAEEKGLRAKLAEGEGLAEEMVKQEELAEKAKELEGEVEALRRELSALRGRKQAKLASLRERLSTMEALSGELSKMQEESAQLETVCRECEGKEGALANIGRKITENERELASCRQRLTAIAHRLSALGELSATARGADAVCPLCRRELDRASREEVVAHLADEEEALRKEEALLQGKEKELLDEGERLSELQSNLKEEIEELKLRTKPLSALLWGMEQARRELAHREEHEAEADTLSRHLAQGKGLDPKLEERLEDALQEFSLLGYDPKRHLQMQGELSAIRALGERLREIENAGVRKAEVEARMEELEGKLVVLEQRLDERSYARELLQRRERTAERRRSLGYDRRAHNQVEVELEHLAGAQERLIELTLGKEREENLGSMLSQLAEQSASKRERFSHLEGELSSYEEYSRRWKEAKERQKQLKEKLGALETEKAQLDRREGTLKERLSALNENRKRADQLRVKVGGLRERGRLARLLAEACGRRGVQARMIETVLDELERSANAILATLTGGSMHLRLITQELTKGGRKREVLRVVVSQGGSRRPFELFSGGEAFRISFALRLAISRLLVGGNGESPPFLVIDEGFGTQDAEGIEAMIETIGKVSADFALILVITHLEELKSRFERVIEVERDGGGFSRVRVGG